MEGRYVGGGVGRSGGGWIQGGVGRLGGRLGLKDGFAAYLRRIAIAAVIAAWRRRGGRGGRAAERDHHGGSDLGDLDLFANRFGTFVLRDVVDRLFHVVVVRTEKLHDEFFVVVRFAVEEIVDLVQTVVQ